MTGVLLNPEYWAEDRSRRWEYWRYLKLAREEFLLESPESNYFGNYFQFGNWLSEKYGIKLNYDDSGNITDESTIIDEEKYLLFQLKYI